MDWFAVVGIVISGAYIAWYFIASRTRRILIESEIFYVGGSFSRYEEVREVIDRLTAMGHECAHDWTRGEWFSTDTGAGDGYTTMSHWPAMAQCEVDAVRMVAEQGGFCIFLGENPSLGWPTEFGMSIAFGVPRIAVVSPFRNTVFLALPQVEEFSSVDDAIDSLVWSTDLEPLAA